MSESRRRGAGILLAAALAIACAACVQWLDLYPLRIAASMLLVLVLPGYALGALALPKERDRSVIVLCVLGGSLAVAALLGVALNLVVGHLDRGGWAIGLAAVVCIAALASLLHPASRPEPGPMSGRTQELPTPAGLPVAFNLTLAALALAAVAGAILIARSAAEHSPPFTELSALPTRSGPPLRLAIKVASREEEAMTYRLLVTEGGRQIERRQIRLEPEQERRILSPPLAADPGKVRVELAGPPGSGVELSASYYPDRG